MSVIAVIGSGAIGGTLAQTLAGRDRVHEVRLIDDEIRIAEGKALDIVQSAPIERFSTRVSAAGSLLSAAGADVIVLADTASASAEYAGEAGLAVLRQLARIESSSPIVLAGATQRDLIERGVAELHLNPRRLVGSAPLALESGLRAIAGLMLDGSGVAVSLSVVGVPPMAAVVAWEEATAFGQPLAAQLPPHEIAALGARIPGLWPPGPYALASAAAPVIEALVVGSRRRYSCFVTSGRTRAVAMPVELGRGGVTRIVEPTLTRQERTMLENALSG